MELIVRLNGQCHKHEYEQSEFNRYSFFEENLNTAENALVLHEAKKGLQVLSSRSHHCAQGYDKNLSNAH